MNRLILISLHFIFFNGLTAFSQKIFPGAEGFGSSSRGAYAGSNNPTILVVDNLSSKNIKTSPTSGSFEWCVTQSFPRIILFEVSGVIDYTSVDYDILVDYPYCNIYGQTAPKNGVTILGAHILFRSHDILVQHMKFRNSDYELRDQTNAIIVSANNIVIDHCSFSFSNDEIVTIWKSEGDVTLSNSIIAFPLNYSKHCLNSGDFNPEGHGLGVIDYAVKNVSYLKNIIAYTVDRNPLSNNSNCVIANNFGYTYAGYGPKIEGDLLNIYKYSVCNNIYLPTASQVNVVWKRNSVLLTKLLSSQSQIWLENNKCINNILHPEYSQWQCVTNNAGCIEPKKNPISMTDFSVVETDSLENYLSKNAGAYYWDRDWIDKMVIDSIKARKMEYINSPEPLPARAYNNSPTEGLKTTAGNMKNGYDFKSKPAIFSVNGKQVSLKSNYTSQQDVLNAINSQLPAGTIAVDHPAKACYHIVIETISKGSKSKLTISGDASAFGIANGIYKGEDGIGGYPKFTLIERKLVIPNEPHAISQNGYTNLELWVASNEFILTEQVALDTDLLNSIIYPNPNNGNFKVSVSNLEEGTEIDISILNQTGQTIYENSCNYERNRSFNVGDYLHPGYYIFVIKIGERLISEKFLVFKD